MNNRKSSFLIKFSVTCSIFLILLSGFAFQVEGTDFSAYDLINAVNNLRISQGLVPVQINAVLMAVAQDHSEYQASMHQSSHAGRSGENVKGRVAASAYGGGKSIVAGENVASLSLGTMGMLQIIINEIWADPVHRGAMINPKYQDIGVGIASDGEMVYVTLNLAGVVSQSSQPSSEPIAVTTGLPPIQPLVTCTPLADGTIYHIVGYGQTLGTIARIYQVNVDDLVRINNIEPDMIYAGQKIWIKKIDLPPSTQTSAATLSAIGTLLPSLKPIPIDTTIPTLTPTMTIEPSVASTPEKVNTREIGIPIIFGIFTLVLVFFIFFANKPQNSSN